MVDPAGLEDADISTNLTVAGEEGVLTQSQLRIVQQLVESAAEPEVVAEAPQAFGFFAKAIASLTVGTVALGTTLAVTGGGGQVPTDQALTEASTNNYDIYRFGSSTGGIAPPRVNDDYVLNSSGRIDAQSFNLNFSYKGASAFRDPYKSGLTGVVYRVPLQEVSVAQGLGVVADGVDVFPNSPNRVGHHTIYPTVEMTPDDFDQRLRSLPWVRVPGRIK